MKIIKFCLLLCCAIYLISCTQVNTTNSWIGDRFDDKIKSISTDVTKGNLAEIATPRIIKQLNQQLEQYTPKVHIISPQKEQILDRTEISIQLEVEGLPLFQDENLKLGNHLNLILDNEPAKQIYDVTQPVVLKNLTPGTHTLRAFASRPWGESYKNESAYAQTTFSILTETNDNRPDDNLPLLTYSNPRGTYGAEPILLDFYLTNASLQGLAQNNPQIEDWRIKTTVNGNSFWLENWQPVYLKGLNKGNNWIQLELIDAAGNNVENTFNDTIRVIKYDPQQIDPLSQLVTNKISLADARAIVEPSEHIQPVGTLKIIEPSGETKAKSEAIAPAEKSTQDNEPAIVTPEPATNLESIPESQIQELTLETTKKPSITPTIKTKKVEEEKERSTDFISPNQKR